jgi:hypothetical protein
MSYRTIFVANSEPTGQILPRNSQKINLINEIVSVTDRFTEDDLTDFSVSDLEALHEALATRNNSFPSLSANRRVEELEQEESGQSSFPSLSAAGGTQ